MWFTAIPLWLENSYNKKMLTSRVMWRNLQITIETKQIITTYLPLSVLLVHPLLDLYHLNLHPHPAAAAWSPHWFQRPGHPERFLWWSIAAATKQWAHYPAGSSSTSDQNTWVCGTGICFDISGAVCVKSVFVLQFELQATFCNFDIEIFSNNQKS